MASPMERSRQGLSKGGLIEISGPDANGNDSRQYIKTFTCCHCSQIVTIDDNDPQMGFCAKCFARECLTCATKLKGICAPFMRKIEEMEQRAKFLDQIG